MRALLFLLGMAIRLGSLAAVLYLLWHAQWRVILTALAFSFAAPIVTALLNIPMGTFWKSLGYPESLTTPGLRALVNPIRLMLVSRVPQFVYGGLALAIGAAAFLLFGSSDNSVERAVFMMAGFDAGFTVPAALAGTLSAQGDSRGVFLSSQIFYGKMAYLLLLIVNFITPLERWEGIALLMAAMFAITIGFEIAAWRRSMADLISA